jgi:hypothetical protein
MFWQLHSCGDMTYVLSLFNYYKDVLGYDSVMWDCMDYANTSKFQKMNLSKTLACHLSSM